MYRLAFEVQFFFSNSGLTTLAKSRSFAKIFIIFWNTR